MIQSNTVYPNSTTIKTEAQKPLVTLNSVAIGYEGHALIDGISLSIHDGDFLAVVGPNGAGKSTLLYTLLGMIRPLVGEVRRRAEIKVGFVPQRSNPDPLFPLRTIDIVRSGGMGNRPAKRWGLSLRLASTEMALAALTELGITELAQHPFRELSGGQQQRVLVARAIVRHPELLVLDEPTAGMDLPSERDLLDLVADLAQKQNMSILLVTHQLSLALQRASRVALMNKDRKVFILEDKATLLSADRLSQIYDRMMEVFDCGGVPMVRPIGREGSL